MAQKQAQLISTSIQNLYNKMVGYLGLFGYRALMGLPNGLASGCYQLSPDIFRLVVNYGCCHPCDVL